MGEGGEGGAAGAEGVGAAGPVGLFVVSAEGFVMGVWDVGVGGVGAEVGEFESGERPSAERFGVWVDGRR